MDENGLPTDAELDAAMKPRGLSVNAPTMLALGAALLPFAIALRIGDLHPVKAVGGGVAILAAIVGIVVAVRRRATVPGKTSGAVAIAAMALGAVQLATAGIGLASRPADPVASRVAALAYLERNQFEDAELVAIDGSPGEFSFEGYKEDRFCSGTVRVVRAGGHTNESWSARCGVDEPRQRAEPSCEGGRASSCGAAARHAREATPPDAASAERFAARGCDANDEASCFELGLALSEAEVTDASRLARGVAAYRTACELGSHAACNNLGVLLRAGRGATVDETAACDAFERACTDAYFHGCGAFADCFADGRGRAQDAARAFALYTSGCAHDDAASCPAAANMRMNGTGTPPDPEAGARELRTLCDADPPNGRACVLLGIALHAGRTGLPKDQEAARGLFERGCRAGSAAACRDAGIYRRDGLGGQARDRETAVTLFTQGCELGDSEACDLAGRRR